MRVLGSVVVIGLTLAVVGACGSADSLSPVADEQPASPNVSELAAPAPAALPETALAALNTLQVQGRAPKTGYSREQFGQAWADVDRNGCDTRTDILNATLLDISRTGRCTVMGGVLNDPYTGRSISYVRGGVSEVDIDHVVALSNAWQTGAFAFPSAKSVALANDPLNLLAVDASANRQKLDGDAATWLPSNRGFRCDYVARQIAVKAKYELWVTPPEAAAMRTILQSCPDERLPDSTLQPTSASDGGGVSNPGSESHVDVLAMSFATCAQARAAGVTPIRRGTDLYAANMNLDGDSDGVACESS